MQVGCVWNYWWVLTHTKIIFTNLILVYSITKQKVLAHFFKNKMLMKDQISDKDLELPVSYSDTKANPYQ
jgi:hypothetical protein